jgi:hypothetical protein
LIPSLATKLLEAQVLISELGEISMKYMFAWLLGVPGVIIIAWFLLNHH